MRLTLRDFIKQPNVSPEFEIVRINGNYIPRLPIADFLKTGLQSEQISIIFVGSHERSMERHLLKPVLHELFDQCSINKNSRYVVLLGKTDWELGTEIAQMMPKNLVRVYGSNLSVANSRLGYMPMGRDFRSLEVFRQVPIKLHRDITCYANFSVSTHPIRKQFKEISENLDFVKTDHMGKFLDYPMTRLEFCQKLSRSKFAICPRGNGIETFRMWDCLYYGVIPIVIKEAHLFNDIEDLPIYFINSVDDLYQLTESMLNELFEQWLNKTWNYAKLDVRFWVRRVWRDFLEYCII